MKMFKQELLNKHKLILILKYMNYIFFHIKIFLGYNGHVAASSEPSVSPAPIVQAPAIKTALLPFAPSKFPKKEIFTLYV